MHYYQPGSFRAEVVRAYGAGTRECLNELETIAMMEVASGEGLPSVAGVGKRQASFVPADAPKNRWRQMVGHMACQVMAGRGYVVDNKRGSLAADGPFTRGATYRWQR